MAKGKRSTDRRQNKDIKVLKKKVKALEAPIERKFLDVPLTGEIGSAPLSIEAYCLNQVQPLKADGTVVATNDGMSQRLGKSIHMNRVRLKGFVEIQGNPTISSPDFGDYIGRARVMVVRWPQNELANTSSPKDFLKPAAYGTSYSTADSFIDGYKLKFPALRYEVLYDRTHNLQTPTQLSPATLAAGTGYGITSVYPCRAKVDIDIKLNHDADWANVESASGTPSQNPIMLYVICGNGAIATGEQRFTILVNSRLNYTDE
ncbi:MAG: coat protein [Cressdnaviricota sp.]|nr:MAG: coat protein [Cressdnaviricota sp.]